MRIFRNELNKSGGPMSKEREKVKCKTELEFITEVADDCVANLKDKDREHLIRNPYAIDYQFSYCLYIRNHYIHNRDFSDVDFWTEPDDLSSEIIRMIFAKLIPEYDYDNQFIENLFDDKRFIQLRQEYRAIYGDYPVAMVEEYKEGISFEPALFMSEISSSNNVDIDKEIEVSKKNHEKSCAHIEKLLKKLAEKVWRLDQLRQTAEECGIDYEELIPKIQEIQKILFEDREYIPVEVCLLPYKKAIGQKRYIEYRRRLSKLLEEHPRLMEKLDLSYFNDRVLAKVVLKYRWPLGLLPYLACKVERWNFVYVDKSYRDDFELVKLCMEQVGNLNTIYEYMSARLRGNKELAMLDLQEDFPNTEYYSSKLRNDDEIAATLFRIHGADSWAWHYMSKRLKKKYKIEER